LDTILTNTLDLAFLNGKVITVDPQDSVLEALGVVGNRIAITGTNADVEAFIGENTKVIDLQGRTLMPGINDTHFHPILGGLLGVEDTDGMIKTTREHCPTLVSMLDMIRDAVKKREPGTWISMMGYEPELFTESLNIRGKFSRFSPLYTNNPTTKPYTTATTDDSVAVKRPE
jgi:predicted amidohydrolase YtcJ